MHFLSLRRTSGPQKIQSSSRLSRDQLTLYVYLYFFLLLYGYVDPPLHPTYRHWQKRPFSIKICARNCLRNGNSNVLFTFSTENPSFKLYQLILFPAQQPHLAKRELFRELRCLVRLSEHEVSGHFQLGAAVLGRNKGFLRPEVIRVGVESLKKEIAT